MADVVSDTQHFYGMGSLRNRENVDSELLGVFNEVLVIYDHSIICGHRIEVDQTTAYENKRSKKQWPDSRHNALPSEAVDVLPWFDDGRSYTREDQCVFAGVVKAVAFRRGVSIRWGGDWDGDNKRNNTDGTTLDDLAHFEIVKGQKNHA